MGVVPHRLATRVRDNPKGQNQRGPIAQITYTAMNDTKVFLETDAAYIAGFIDGEGSFSMYPEIASGRIKGYSLRLDITNCNQSVLLRIRRLAGCGTVRTKKNAVPSKHKQIFILRFHANGIRRILPEIREHLLVKADQAKIMAEALDLNKRENFSDERMAKLAELYVRMRHFNKRGLS